jgi:2'-5' RNA ligase
LRLFVAIELSERNRSRLAQVQESLRHQCHGVKWIPSHQLHMTVKFLGDVPDAKVPEVSAALNRAAFSATVCTMELQGAGCFPPKGPARIVWTGAAEPTGALTKLVDAVESELSQIQFPRERRPFSPHITIGRVRNDDSDGRIRAAVDSASYKSTTQDVKKITLMSSVLSPKGPTYAAVSRARIG